MTPVAQRRVGDLDFAEFRSRIAGAGLGLRLGPFDALLAVEAPGLHRALHAIYTHYHVLEGERAYSFRARLRPVWQLRPRPARMVRFTVDDVALHEDLPLRQGLAVLEWGINLVIALRFHCFLALHAAVLERNGRALLLPAAPGHGKTTLCAALAHRGWRLLSDEFGLVRPGTVALVPIPRPMPLKNDSIAVIRTAAPDAVIGPEITGTRKGTVAHVRPTASSVQRSDEHATAAWVVFPRWQAGAALNLVEVSPAESFMRLATNAFNYEMLGESGFAAVRDLVARTRGYRLVYSDLEQAVEVLGRLADGADG